MIATNHNQQDQSQSRPGGPIKVTVQVPVGLECSRMEFLFQVTGQSITVEPDFSSTVEPDYVPSPSTVSPPRLPASPPPPPPDVTAQNPSEQRQRLEPLWRQICEARDVATSTKKAVHSTLAGLRAFDSYIEKGYRSPHAVPFSDHGSLLRFLDGHPSILFEFGKWDIAEHGRSPKTVAGHITAVRKLLRVAMKQRMIRDLPEAPTIQALEKMAGIDENVDEIPETVTLEEMLRIREAASTTKWPRLGPSPQEFWEAFIDVHWTYGPRTLDWFSYKPSEKPGLLWDHVTFDSVCPSLKLKGFEWEHGWVWLPIAKTVTRRLLLPLSSRVRRHLEIWTGVSPDRVWPIRNSPETYSKHWRRLLKEADVDQRIRPSEGRGIPSLRKGCSDFWQSCDRESLEAYVLCHADGGKGKMASKHYAQRVKLVCQHIENVPFSSGPPAADD